ncbi:ankyrin repeat domain-containing protein, partial [Candidatus Babeliales bacterium]|nr:ankyrin repeat domain-containing protein [Candidatus Babeliales bacterium]
MISRFIGLVFCIIFASTVCVRPAASSSGNGNYYAHSPAGYPAIQGYPSVSYLRVFPNGRDILPDDKLCKILSYAECGDVHALNKILYDNLNMDPNQALFGIRPIDVAIQNGHIECVHLFCYYFLINDYYQGSVEPPLFKAIACHQN